MFWKKSKIYFSFKQFYSCGYFLATNMLKLLVILLITNMHASNKILMRKYYQGFIKREPTRTK